MLGVPSSYSSHAQPQLFEHPDGRRAPAVLLGVGCECKVCSDLPLPSHTCPC